MAYFIYIYIKNGYAARPLVSLYVHYCELQKHHSRNAPHIPWWPNSTHSEVYVCVRACVCLSLMQITRAFVFRELSDIWPGSEPKGRGAGASSRRGVRRGEKSAGTLLNCTGRRCERTYNSLGQQTQRGGEESGSVRSQTSEELKKSKEKVILSTMVVLLKTFLICCCWNLYPPPGRLLWPPPCSPLYFLIHFD